MNIINFSFVFTASNFLLNMAAFQYNLPISFNLEAPLFREGEKQHTGGTQYVDLSVQAK